MRLPHRIIVFLIGISLIIGSLSIPPAAYAQGDIAPFATAITPHIGSGNNSVLPVISIRFSERITYTGLPALIDCFEPNGSNSNYAVRFTVWDNTLLVAQMVQKLPYNATCIVTLPQGAVRDTDTQDPPDNPISPIVWSFRTMAADAPVVITTISVSVAGFPEVRVTTNDDVFFYGRIRPAYADCIGIEGDVFSTLVLFSGGPRNWVGFPTGGFPFNTVCTLTIPRTALHDKDLQDPPDSLAVDFTHTFIVGDFDQAPRVDLTEPLFGTVNFNVAANLNVTFTEAVNLAGGAFTLTCNNVAKSFALSGGPTTFTLNPNANLPFNTTCRLTVIAGNVSDQDPFDPPNSMAENFVLDFDTQAQPGDKLGVWRSGNQNFFLRNALSAGSPNFTYRLGLSTDIPITGDWNGDGVDTGGVWRPSNGTFFLTNSNPASGTAAVNVSFAFGLNGDIPIVGDWDGNGTDGIGVYRPSTRQFLLRNALSAGPANFVISSNIVADFAFAGDWDGNGTDSPGLFLNGPRQFLLSNSVCNSCALVLHHLPTFGLAGDRPITGDWDGDGIDTIGVWRPSNATFFLRNALTTGAANVSFAFGLNGDRPVAGVWQLGTPDERPDAPSFIPKQ